MCMPNKYHLTFNFKPKVSYDIFKNKNDVNGHLNFPVKCHLHVTCLALHVIAISNELIDVWFFPEQVTLHAKFQIVCIN